MTSIEQYYKTYWTDSGFNPGGRLTLELIGVLDKTITPGSSVLDLGCGDGQTTAPWLLQLNCSYTGCDISETAIEKAQQSGFNATLIQDIAQLPFDDCQFDHVICTEVLEHLFAPQLAATEALRVLKPGGTAIFTVPNVSYWRRRLELLGGRFNPIGDTESAIRPWRDPHIRFFTPTTPARMLVEQGFQVRSSTGFGGAFVRDIPIIGRLLSKQSSSIYRLFERLFPGLLAYGCCAIAEKS